MARKKIGILTGGGDCPGLNAVIRAIVRKGVVFHNFDFVGIYNGWAGLMKMDTVDLTLRDVSGILHRGGTILKTSRTNPLKEKDGMETIERNIQELGLSGLIVVGGEDTLGVAAKLHEEGINCVGVPKTIDNDLSGTDYTFGFDTAVNIATEAIDRVHTTAESHNRVMVVEVMGRHTGWIAVEAGIAGGADMVLVPEKQIDVKTVNEAIIKRHRRGKDFSIVVVAEGAQILRKPDDEGTLILQDQKTDEFGHVRLGGIGSIVAKEIEKGTGFETRVVILGHIQRGGSPTAFDRVLGTRYGIAAIDLVAKGEFGKMVSLRGNKIIPVDLSEAVSEVKFVDPELIEIAEVFYG